MTQITDEMKVAAVKAYTEVDGKCRPAAMQKALEAALAFLPIAVEGKVKALEWYKPLGNSTLSRADTILGSYRVWTHFEANGEWFWDGGNGHETAATSEEAAKAAAQSDYENRILSALSSSPVKDGGQVPEPAAHGQYRELLQALSRLAGNRQKDGTSSLVSREDREAIINGCHDLMIAARQPPSTQPASTALVERLTKALEWRLNEEGWQIADTFFGGYRVERNPHDHWCWGVFFHGGKGVGLNPADNFEAAKAAAQADFNERISSALDAKQSPDFRDMIIIGDTAYPVHSEVCRAFNELSAALVVGEPVAWTTQAQIDKFKVDPGCNAVMWGEPLPHHPDIPLYAAPSAPDGWQPIETAPKDGTVIMAWHTVHNCPIAIVWKEPGHPFNEDVLNWYEKSYTTAWPERCFSHWQPLLSAPPALGGASHE